ncbi:MAG: hypothetical protein GYB68_10760 [Chloroflexi bacterium]|nr:hypothetical protein [Chloroflexota bacterium]
MIQHGRLSKELLAILVLFLLWATVACSSTATVEPTPTPQEQLGFETGSAMTDLNAFQTRLGNAIQDRDWTTARSLMGEPFYIGYWEDGPALEVDRAEAIDILQVSHIAPEGTIQYFINASPSMGDDIPGQEYFNYPAGMMAWLGWGIDNSDNAVAVVRQAQDGTFYWESLIASSSNFSASSRPGGVNLDQYPGGQ